MAAYEITGHPLNPAELGLSPQEAEAVYAALRDNGVGKTVTLTLSGPNDTKIKGHKVFK